MKKERNSLIDIIKSFRINIKIDFYKKEETKKEDKTNIFKNGDVFAYMFNNDIQKIKLNLDTETLKFTLKDGTESFVIHELSTTQFYNLTAKIKDQARMDLSIRKGKQYSKFNPKYGNIKMKEEFEVVQNNEEITITINKPNNIKIKRKEFQCVSV